jgi:ferredoxin
MIFRVFAKNALADVFASLATRNEVVGPVLKALRPDGSEVFSFEHVREFSSLRLDYTMTRLPAKRFFLPFTENLATYRIEDARWEKHVDFHMERPLALFGLHTCDINALNKLDKVLMEGEYPMPFYIAKRGNMFIVGTDCMPEPTCFCRSMGADSAIEGFDMLLTDLGDRYFAEILSATAFNLLKEIECREPDERDHIDYRHRVDERIAAFTATVDTTDLTKILDMEFQSTVWKQWGEKCFSCGACAMVCPTCYCYGVEENVSLDMKSARKTKCLHSCNLVDFATVAGGHNFRPGRDTRLKYRYYHKHRGFVEAYEQPLCVGCGRCGIACLGGITVPEVIASVRSEEA